ncbi:MAG TPA: amidohydrolase [Candidatus Binatia bacterium]|jgi:predicted TIM-barrel fold metal-dependent hydrolase
MTLVICRALIHAAALFGSLILSGCLIDRLGGAFRHEPEELEKMASQAAQKLITQAFTDLDAGRLVDYHTHIVAIGTSVKSAFVNPRSLSGVNLDRAKFWIYASASGIRDEKNADAEYLDRLVGLARAIKPGGKFRILAFDKHYNAAGSVNLRKTYMYVPNEYVVGLAAQYSDIFLPVVSIHPYRLDALQELDQWGRAGIRYVKWLPNAMGIDPANPAVEPYYRKMKEHGMILLSHGGEEQAVEADEDQRLGNPLLLRRPLDLGVRVIIAHAASLGTCEDLDHGAGKTASCFELFLRMMDEPKYRGLLFGEISAMLQFNRMPVPLATLLKRQDLHSRLVNGSDYPLPAINSLIWTRALVRDGFITAAERQALNEIYDYNPLLFDFVLKRTVRHPETKQRLAASVFMTNPGLE